MIPSSERAGRRVLPLFVLITASLLLVPALAHAGKKNKKGADPVATAVAYDVAASDDDSDGGPGRSDEAHGRGTGGIPAVLQKLDELERKLDENAAQIEELQGQVEMLDANVTPCTLERFRNGLCGEDNHPLDLLVSVCAGVGADAGLALKYAFTSNLDVQAGIGWKDAPDVHIVENAQVPAIITPFGIPIILPSELGAQVDAGAGLGLDGCLAPIRIPIGKQLAEPVVLAILENLEAQAQPVADALTAQLQAGQGGGSAAGMGLAQVASALTAADALRNQEIADDDPMAAFGRGPIADLASNLPVGSRLMSIVGDPKQMALPGLASGGSSASAAGGGSAVAGLDGIVGNVCGGPVANAIGPLCDFIGTRVPGIDRVLALVPAIEIIPDIVNDAVDGVRELIGPLLSDVGEAASDTLSRFCASPVGQTFIFDRLCGR